VRRRRSAILAHPGRPQARGRAIEIASETAWLDRAHVLPRPPRRARAEIVRAGVRVRAIDGHGGCSTIDRVRWLERIARTGKLKKGMPVRRQLADLDNPLESADE
jgi:hypothetical protein